MLAAVLYGPSDLRIEEVEVPVPAVGEVVIRVEVALTDGRTARTVRRGPASDRDESPLPLGHVCVGRIVSVGDGVTGFEPGGRSARRPAGRLRMEARSIPGCGLPRRATFGRIFSLTSGRRISGPGR